MESWYVVQCKPRQETRAEENLLRQGYACYRPMHVVERLVRGRRVARSESLFPGYLFIQLGESPSWASVRSTRGVATLVSFSASPAQVSDELIKLLRQREQAEVSQDIRLFEVGARLRIKEGPFAELEAVYAGMDGNERAIVLLNILQREQRLRVPLKSLTVVS